MKDQSAKQSEETAERLAKVENAITSMSQILAAFVRIHERREWKGSFTARMARLELGGIDPRTFRKHCRLTGILGKVYSQDDILRIQASMDEARTHGGKKRKRSRSKPRKHPS